MLLDLRHDLRIGQLVCAFDRDDALRQHFGATETILELQLGLTWPEEQKSVRLAKLADNVIVYRSRSWLWRSSYFFSPPPSWDPEYRVCGPTSDISVLVLTWPAEIVTTTAFLWSIQIPTS